MEGEQSKSLAMERLLIPFAKYILISCSLSSSLSLAERLPRGLPNGFPSALRLAKASVVLKEINSRSISAAREANASPVVVRRRSAAKAAALIPLR